MSNPQGSGRIRKRLQDFLIYILVGVAVSLGLIWYADRSNSTPGNQDVLRWGGLVANTALLYGYMIKWAKPFWHSWALWGTVLSVFVLHVTFFSIVLQTTEHWSASFFLFMYPVEVPLIAIVSDWAVHATGAQPRFKRSTKAEHQ